MQAAPLVFAGMALVFGVVLVGCSISDARHR
jgi:hypothetical protein